MISANLFLLLLKKGNLNVIFIRLVFAPELAARSLVLSLAGPSSSPAAPCAAVADHEPGGVRRGRRGAGRAGGGGRLPALRRGAVPPLPVASEHGLACAY